MTNPAYHGAIRTKEGLFPGRHKPIISRRLFDEVRDTLSRRDGMQSKHKNAFKGLLKCGDCGRQLTLTEKSKGGNAYRYIHCYAPKAECSRPTFGEQELSDSLVSVMEGIQITPDIEQMLRRLIAESEDEESFYRRERNARIVSLKAEAQGKEDQKHAALRMRLNGEIDEEEHARVIAELDDEVRAIEGKIEELRSEDLPHLGSIEEIFELVKHAPELYMRQNHEERAKVLRIVTSNCEVTAGSIVPIYREPFSGIAKGLDSGDWWACLDSNQGPPAYQASALTD